MSNTTKIDKLLEERGERYGEFSNLALISQLLKAVMNGTIVEVVASLSPEEGDNFEGLWLTWVDLPATHKEGLEMIAHKIARLLNGDPLYVDNLVDIQGYAKLIEEACKEVQDGNIQT